MKPRIYMLHLLLLFIFLASSSCGGGGGGGNDYADGGGIGGTGVVSSGSITDIGSIWVNGVRFDTGNAEVYVDDEFQGGGDQTVVDNLDLGRVVRVNGRLDPDGNGYADEVHYTSQILGPIDAIQVVDQTTRVLTVLGQHIIIDSRSFLKDVTLDALALGDLVEVSGFWDENSDIQGTFLIRHTAPPNPVFRITGPVSGLDTNNETFLINSQIIDYSQADMDSLLPSGIGNDLFVCVAGRLVGNVFEADLIVAYSRLGDDDAENIEIEGVVGTVIQPDLFTMEGFLVEVTPATEFVGGDSGDILAGVRIEVEGSYSTGVLLAEKIAFDQMFRAESDLAAKAPDGTLIMVGLGGLTVQTNALTRISGLAASLDEVNVGDHLVIKGWPIDDQTVTAGQIIKLPAVQNKIVLRGIVTLINEPTIVINNVSVNTILIPNDGFYLADEIPVSRQQFFDQVLEDDWVEVRGELGPGNSVTWNSIGLAQSE